MKKNIKYITLLFGYFAQANNDADERERPVGCTMEAKLCPDGVTSVGRVGPKCEFQACPGEKDNLRGGEFREKFKGVKDDLKYNREENKERRDEFKSEVGTVKDEFRQQREINKEKIKGMVESVKAEREKFKTEFEGRKEEAKTKVEEMRTKFKEDLGKIKDEKKKLSSEKILEIIQNLNTKLTDNLSEKVDKIENVLVSIESRINKAEEKGLDVSKAKNEAEKAKTAIKTAREAVSAQAVKVYSVNITTEATLKANMKRLRDLFRADMKVVYEKVKLAHVAVKTTAEALAKVPKVDDDDGDVKEDDSIEVETSTSASVTNTN